MAEDVALNIKLDAGNSPRTLGGLRKQVADLNEELENAELGTQAYEDLRKELVLVDKEVKNLELGFEALDVEQQATELGSVAGAVGDVTSAFILLGGESETLEQIAANIEKAIGVSMAFKGAIEGVASARKLLNSLDKESILIKTKDIVLSKAKRAAEIAMIAVTKTAATVTKTFNLILNSNPAILIATAIAGLITGIIALVKNFDAVSAAAKEFGKMLLRLIDPFGLLKTLTGDLRTEEEKAADSRRHWSKELSQQTSKRLKEIEEVRKKEAAAHKQRLTAFDLEIKRLEAEGKSSFKVRLEMLEDILAEKKAVLQANNDKIQSYIDYYTNLAALRGQDLETFKASMKAQGTDLDALQQKALDQQQTLKDAIFQAETDIIALKRKRSEEQRRISDKARQEEEKEQEKALQAQLKRIDEEAKAHAKLIEQIEALENEYFDSLLTDQEREENAVRDKYFNLIEQARQYNEDITILEQAREEELFRIRQEFAQKEAEAQAERDEQEKQNKLDKMAQTEEEAQLLISGAEDVLKTVSAINDLAFQRDIARINAKKQAGEKLTKDELKRLKNNEKMQKTFAAAQVVIDTARSIGSVIAGATAAAAAGGPAAPFLIAGYIASGVAAVTTAFKQVNDILKTPSPSISASGGGSNAPSLPDAQGAGQDAPNTDLFNTGSTLINIPPIKVAVLEQDITDTQTNVAEIVEQATFG